MCSRSSRRNARISRAARRKEGLATDTRVALAIVAVSGTDGASRAHGYGWTITNDQIAHQQDGAGQARVTLGIATESFPIGSSSQVALEHAFERWRRAPWTIYRPLSAYGSIPTVGSADGRNSIAFTARPFGSAEWGNVLGVTYLRWNKDAVIQETDILFNPSPGRGGQMSTQRRIRSTVGHPSPWSRSTSWATRIAQP